MSIGVHHITELNEDIIKTEIYEFWSFMDSKPEKKELILAKQKELSKEQYKIVKQNLQGKWTATSNPIPFDTMFSDFNEFINPKFSIKFKNDKYKYYKSGILKTENNRKKFSKTSKGTWTLGPMGNYIILKPKKGYNQTITLMNSSDKEVTCHMDVKALEENYTVGSTKIKLIKSP